MRRNNIQKLLPRLAICLACVSGNGALAAEIDHREFEATLHVPFKANAERSDARIFKLEFDYPFVATAQNVSWQVELVGPTGQLVQRWVGAQRLFKKKVAVNVRWDGRADSASVRDGLYTVRMQAVSHDAQGNGAPDNSPAAVEQALATGDVIEQSWELAVGTLPAPAMPPFAPL